MRNTVLCRTIIKVFVIVYLSMLFIMIPNIINNHGLFLYAGDYYFQLTFYIVMALAGTGIPISEMISSLHIAII